MGSKPALQLEQSPVVVEHEVHWVWQAVQLILPPVE